jgi:hypothetical protein
MTAIESPYYRQVMEEIDEFPLEHLPALLQIMRLMRENLAMKSPAESFRQAWKEAMNDETLPLAELWSDIDAD